MEKSLADKIIDRVYLLKDNNDCVAIKIDDEQGLLIQVVDYGEGKEYLVELNNIDAIGYWEPCAIYNASSEYGNINKLIKTINEYLRSYTNYRDLCKDLMLEQREQM